MKPFIDLQGGSGATYRFRSWPQDRGHPPMAGLFAFVRPGEGGAAEVIAVGETLDLSRLRPPASGADLLIFTRLNVSRQARVTEHQDLAARHPGPESLGQGRQSP